jgi:hypothetical protein
MLLAILNQLLAALAVILAIRFGEASERAGAFVILLMILVSDVRFFTDYLTYFSVDYIAFLCDISGFIGFSIIGIFQKRIWPLWAAALQLLSVGAHFVRALELPVRPIVYAWMKAGPTWAVLFLLIAATIANLRWRSLQNNERS